MSTNTEDEISLLEQRIGSVHALLKATEDLLRRSSSPVGFLITGAIVMLEGPPGSDDLPLPEVNVAKAIDDVRQDERERCAKVADGIAESEGAQTKRAANAGLMGDANERRHGARVARDIADDIRKLDG